VLVVQTLGTPHPDRRRRRRRRAKTVESPAELAEVPVARCTVALGTPFGGEQEAARWLEEIGADPKRRAERVREALAVVNRGLDALRRAAEDPLVNDASLAAALAIRIGYGSGEQLADGHWAEALQLPATGAARHEDLDAQRRAALELAGIDPDADPPGDE
jgi:hypothetical protein